MKKQSVKERIIETASDLFYNNGYNQTGVNQIIAEAAVAKASMYQHFRSKEDIAVAYLRQHHIKWMGSLTEFVSNEKNDTQKLIKSFDFLKTWLSDVKYRGCGFQNIICDLPKDQQKIKDQVVLHKNDVKKLVYSLLEDKQNQEELGNELLVLMEGAIILSQIQKNNWPIIAAKSAATKLLSY
ncbi:TetR/AcrR family transcriptional regulator [Tenacibaculum ovolyticum]|uniref:TetR/AcrR family transcriptional regulator n=1 Tax=Tenacibaculum ovolyticum TaxID=104270 RepID=UPI001F37606A|nr:TetR/AcrR family transcriptional regulator [Tenacibaculum ovolyticum]